MSNKDRQKVAEAVEQEFKEDFKDTPDMINSYHARAGYFKQLTIATMCRLIDAEREVKRQKAIIKELTDINNY